MSSDNCVSRVILIAFMLAAVGFAAQTVDGHVVNSVTGIDISGVGVNLIRDGQVAYSATTDDKGCFQIEAVEGGIYTAHYTARGFWSIPNFFVDELFELQCGRPGCFRLERGDQPFQVTAGGDPVRLDVKMPPLGKISGRVLDGLGEPVANARLQLHWGENWLCKRLEWAQTFYPGVIYPQLSVRVMVQPGSEVSNADIKLSTVPVHRIRGVVLDISGNPVPKATVTLRKGIGPPALIQNTTARLNSRR